MPAEREAIWVPLDGTPGDETPAEAEATVTPEAPAPKAPAPKPSRPVNTVFLALGIERVDH